MLELETHKGVEWRVRYTRAATWAAEQTEPPDIIGLTNVWLAEIPVWGQPNLDQYESVFIFLRTLREQTGANYRVAWAGSGARGIYSELFLVGSAVLYNADRMRNVTASVFSEAPEEPWGLSQQATGPQLRLSQPCPVDPYPMSAEAKSLCSFIDPLGHVVNPYWRTYNYRTADPPLVPNDHTFLLGSTAGAFSLNNGESVFVFHNVQIDPNGYLESFRAFRELLDKTKEWSGDSELTYPPIAAGDFNAWPLASMSADTDLGGRWPDYHVLAGWPPGGEPPEEEMGILIGDADAYDAQIPSPIARPYGECRGVIVDPSIESATPACGQLLPEAYAGVGRCDAPAEHVWSDHCGIYVRISGNFE